MTQDMADITSSGPSPYPLRKRRHGEPPSGHQFQQKQTNGASPPSACTSNQSECQRHRKVRPMPDAVHIADTPPSSESKTGRKARPCARRPTHRLHVQRVHPEQGRHEKRFAISRGHPHSTRNRSSCSEGGTAHSCGGATPHRDRTLQSHVESQVRGCQVRGMEGREGPRRPLKGQPRRTTGFPET